MAVVRQAAWPPLRSVAHVFGRGHRHDHRRAAFFCRCKLISAQSGFYTNSSNTRLEIAAVAVEDEEVDEEVDDDGDMKNK